MVELELLKALSTGSVSAIALSVVFLLLKLGPSAFRELSRERTRAKLIRRALDGKTEKERRRARDLLTALDPPSLVDGRPPDNSEDRPPPDEVDP